MATGRPPKPVEAKRRAGNPGKRSLPAPITALPAVPVGAKSPYDLKAPGKRLWEGVVAHAQAWITPAFDFGTLHLACRAFDDLDRWRRLIVKQGEVLREPIVTPSGEVVGERLVTHPLLRESRVLERQLERWLSALALTPTDRARLGLAQVKAQSKLEALIERRNAG